MASLPVTIYQYAGSAFDDWVQLAWVGALLITVGVLALNIVARVRAARQELNGMSTTMSEQQGQHGELRRRAGALATRRSTQPRIAIRNLDFYLRRPTGR